eukprot:RCo042305
MAAVAKVAELPSDLWGVVLLCLHPKEVVRLGVLVCAGRECPCPWVMALVREELQRRTRPRVFFSVGQIYDCAISPTGDSGFGGGCSCFTSFMLIPLSWGSDWIFKGDRIAVAYGLHGPARVLSLGTGEELLKITRDCGPLCSVRFSPDGGLLLSGSTPSTAVLFDTLKWAPLVTYKGHTDPVTGVAFSSDKG